MTSATISAQRLKNQYLLDNSLSTAAEVVRWLGAVQSQDYAGAKWALAQRLAGISDGDLDQLFDAGAILRTHVMRPTWHFVRPEDIRWMLMLTGPRVHALNAYYYRKLELDDAIFARSTAALIEALQGNTHLTRTELAGVLERIGISASGPKLAYILMWAELEAVICSGPRRGKQFTYALLEERAPNARTLEREEALAELTKRYFTSHGPAQISDFVWWSGLTTADAKAGIALNQSHLIQEVCEGKTYWSAPPSTALPIQEPLVHLLPNYDEYLVAYKDHSATFTPPADTDRASTETTLGVHILTINGQVRGGWRRTFQKKSVHIEVTPLSPLTSIEREALHTAAEEYRQFLDMTWVSVGVRE